MNRPIYHHKVSRYWLSYFADRSNKINVYDKLLGKTFPGTPAKIGGENNYYDIRTNEERDVVEIERKLAVIEGRFAKTHKKIIENEAIQEEDKDYLTHLLVLQVLRTSINVSKEEFESILDFVSSKAYRIENSSLKISLFWKLVVQTIKENGVDWVRDFKMDHFIEEDGLVYKKIKKHIKENGNLTLLKSKEKNLIISDKPVLLAFNAFTADGGGFLSKSMMCIAPLSEKIALLMTTDSLLLKTVKDSNNIMSATLVDSLNSCQFLNCERQVYSSDESIFKNLQFELTNYQAQQLWWRADDKNGFLMFSDRSSALTSLGSDL